MRLIGVISGGARVPEGAPAPGIAQRIVVQGLSPRRPSSSDAHEPQDLQLGAALAALRVRPSVLDAVARLLSTQTETCAQCSGAIGCLKGTSFSAEARAQQRTRTVPDPALLWGLRWRLYPVLHSLQAHRRPPRLRHPSLQQTLRAFSGVEKI